MKPFFDYDNARRFENLVEDEVWRATDHYPERSETLWLKIALDKWADTQPVSTRAVDMKDVQVEIYAPDRRYYLSRVTFKARFRVDGEVARRWRAVVYVQTFTGEVNEWGAPIPGQRNVTVNE